MTEQLRTTLADITQQYGDYRVHHCQLEAAHTEDGSIILTGTVLDESTLKTVTRDLANHYPSVAIDASALTVLTQADPTVLTVATNIASLHAQTSSMSERVSQILNGWRLELLSEEGEWAYTRQSDGYLGWVFKRYLGQAPPAEFTHLVMEPVSLMRKDLDEASAIVGRIVSGMSVTVDEIRANYGHIELAGGLSGWVPVAHLKALSELPVDEDEQRRQMAEYSLQFIGVPYLWGGISGLGIDCSGYARLLHNLVGVQIPRDADMQYEVGKPVAPPFQVGDLLFFGSGQSSRSITHVGMSLGGWRTIHSSGPRNGVYIDDVQAVSWLNDRFVGAGSFLGS